MKKFIAILMFSSLAHGTCLGPKDFLVLGDSQTGATWAKSYFGNFLQECLRGDFIIFGKGGSNPSSWYGRGNLPNVEIIKRDSNNPHQNLGLESGLPLCQKRVNQMIDEYQPKKILFFFGDNMIASSDDDIKKEMNGLLSVIADKKIKKEDCYFLTPTYEMEVKSKRNVSRKNLANTTRISKNILQTIQEKCQHLDGLEIMKDSPFFDGKELLRRVLIQGRPGCGGAAENDNIHICGEAAKDLAEKVCQKLNS